MSGTTLKSDDQRYQAWVDVGGTFTDCFLYSPQSGDVSSCKVLSSGLLPIPVSEIEGEVLKTSRLADPPGFWKGALLHVINEAGTTIDRLEVEDSGLDSIRVSSFEHSDPTLRFELNAQLEAPVLGVRRLLGVALKNPLPRLSVRMGTTKGTNALLTRGGAKTALCITKPFEQLLEIGDQTRPDLFALTIAKAPPLADWTIGIEERLDAQGKILVELNEATAITQLQELKQLGCESLAICLMNSHVNPIHEQALKRLAKQLGFEQVSVSTELAPLIEIVARAQTSVVDGYLSPIIRNYLGKLAEQFQGELETSTELLVMTSAGGLVEGPLFSGKDSILSGPAGGVCALEAIGNSFEIESLLGFDMGGTSTDVCRVQGSPELQFESTKAGVRILVPTLPIETVASGGGSICWFDGVSLRVGPQSAGATPGPACYGRGGPLTITDLNVFLGRVPRNQFPFELDTAAIESRLEVILEASSDALNFESQEELCHGFRRIAIEQMSEAVRSVSIAQGADPRTHTLVGFGGAAGQHICEVAEALGISQIIDVPHAGLLSALGMGLAPRRTDATIPVYQPLANCDATDLFLRIESKLNELESELGAHNSQSQLSLELRYAGTDSTLTVQVEKQDFENQIELAQESFHNLHQARFGYERRSSDVELVSVRLESYSVSDYQLPKAAAAKRKKRLNLATSEDHSGLPEQSRSDLKPGHQVIGPAIVLNEGSTLVVDSGWLAECYTEGSLVLSRIAEVDGNHHRKSENNAFDPVFRDCYAARMSAIAEQMGIVLQQTAVSVNVKQRRDYSCAVFDGEGLLLANAPHVPVHLGAMGKTVRSVMQLFPNVQPGDCFITNDPYQGGSHLPDITVITPVFAESESGASQLSADASSTRPAMFVANRAHHADVGGISPGSMSVLSSTLEEEGVVISPMRLTNARVDCSDALKAVLTSAKYPARNPNEVLADVAAQQAANNRGVELLKQYAASESWRKLTDYAGYLLDAAEQRVRQFLLKQPDLNATFEDHLDDGTPIKVRVHSNAVDSLIVDFAGTGDVSPTNFNANPSIVTAATMYVLRCLIADELPLNEGVMRCIELRIPNGILNPPHVNAPKEAAAVAAGNVETSQRVVDVLLGAFGAAAASQGTMNNLLFGNENFGFYETICGGSGATEKGEGVNGVHTHMTNTRLTDPEVLEAKYPVRLTQFALRSGSGGEGRNSGGEGVEREIEFLEPATVSLLTSRRGPYAPFGIAGGKDGALGENILVSNGQEAQLENCVTLQVSPGDRVRILTPGGGGFGEAT